MPEQTYPPRRRRRRKPSRWPYVLIALLVAVLIGLAIAALKLPSEPQEPTSTTVPTSDTTPTREPTAPPTEPTEPPTEPPVTQTGSATVANMGDMLMHKPCFNGGKNSDGTYDMRHYFTNIKPYIESAAFAVTNLETTLAGTDNGYDYGGYPNFNCPDAIVDDLKATGFDMLLTANNHCYDTSSVGFHRTQEIIAQAGLLNAGTMADAESPSYQIVTADGISIGMLTYTYEDNSDPNVVAPNGHTMNKDDGLLINSFNANELPTFYQNVENQIADMRADGAEAIVLYIHWGDEYQIKENSTQRTIAQEMCDLGVDVIVGGHPHVIQPMDLLTSTEDPGHRTVCLYSTGNALSNQRRNLMRLDTGHTEDGIIFNYTFVKYSDGTVRLEGVEVIPTWINLYTDSDTGRKVYDILPLDASLENWQASFDLTDSGLKNAQESYDRTMAIVGEGLEEINEYLSTLPEIE